MSLSQTINGRLRVVPAWPVYVLGAIPPVWLYYQGLTGGLGPDPVKGIERQMGLLALQVMIAVLAITPIRNFLGINLIRYRRALGLVAFFYVLVHFLTWVVLDMGLLWDQMLRDIVKRPYVTIGMIGLLALIPLAVTSNNWSIRKMGPVAWKRLHRLTYVAAVAGVVHYIWLVKAWPIEPFLYAGAILVLLALRVRLRTARVAAPGPSVGANPVR
jgi:methionine sulfoxide reductase heme-binding subunit